MKQKTFEFQNFVRGLKRDSTNPEDMLNSLYTMTNYKLNHEDGMARLEARQGFSRWNTEPLPAVAKQLFMHTDQTRTDWLLGVCNSKWYWIGDIASVLLKNETATVPQDGTAGPLRNLPVITIGNRAMFGTDSSWNWTDGGAMTGIAPQSFQVGIDPPTENPSLELATAEGNTVLTGAVILNTDTQRKFAFIIRLARDTTIGHLYLNLNLYNDPHKYDAGVKLSIYTNSGGSPTTILADPDAISEPLDANQITSSYKWHKFIFEKPFELEANTTYWGVVEGTSTYYDVYHFDPLVPLVGFHAHIRYSGSLPSGASKRWDTTVGGGSWVTTAYEINLIVGGMVNALIYDYVCTYANSTYGIESRPSGYARIQRNNSVYQIVDIDLPVSADPQVDRVNIYRRLLDTGLLIDCDAEDITTKYQYVGYASGGSPFGDTLRTEQLGGYLQTEDHYRIGEEDSGVSPSRIIVVPKVATYWKGRTWVANGSKIYFSKKLESDGASGLAGDPIPDYFPPENQIDTYMTSAIIAMRPLADDQFVIYFANSAIWIMMGMDSVLNPPDPGEYRFIPVVTDSGLIASSALCDLKSRHVYLARKGLYVFNGTANTEYVSENIQSILNTLTDPMIDNSVMIGMGDELWLGVDTDNDGKIEDFYIFDMQKSVPYWRKYNYGISIYDMVVKESGRYDASADTGYKTIYASDADNLYILKLETGNDDNGQAIECEFETHALRPGRWGFVHGIELIGYYPEIAPTFTIKVTDHVQGYLEFGLQPSGSSDVRGHRAGLRFNSPYTLKVSVKHYALALDKILGFKLNYNTE